MNEIVLASANKKKIAELKDLLKDVSVLSLNDIGFHQEIEEPFFTFNENAFQKANTIHQFCGKNVLADDSGICIQALDNAPGVLSSRFAGHGATDQDNLDKVLFQLKDKTDRRAYYKAVLCLIWNGAVHYFEGDCHGILIDTPIGTNGFGYDPIFVPDGYTESFAQLDSSIKQQISHRAKAMQQLLHFINSTQ
ncbi:MAG: RdgB/HAM1 family non-canonical purine NTP pyrophosphatase [Phycisphaerales bacterium]|nr:RdgB/HAM1 family non-canonical purine NTP pyrophosphatase [Phycisphaerales bacterium]